jgi:hypothetical protein
VIGRACAVHKNVGLWLKNLKERDNLEDLSVNGITTKMEPKEIR